MEECFICFVETDEFVMFKCSHKVCATCFPRLRTNKCPMCNEPIVILQPSNVITQCITISVMLSTAVAIILFIKRDDIF
jgi:hypothetical protein